MIRNGEWWWDQKSSRYGWRSCRSFGRIRCTSRPGSRYNRRYEEEREKSGRQRKQALEEVVNFRRKYPNLFDPHNCKNLKLQLLHHHVLFRMIFFFIYSWDLWYWLTFWRACYVKQIYVNQYSYNEKIIWNNTLKVKVLTVSTIRLLRNRVSAQQARERKKAYLLELEVRVKELEKKNSEVEERLSTLQNENQMLRHVRFLFSLPFFSSQMYLIWFDWILGMQILKNTTAGMQERK